jgi:hypothetical protein
MKDQRILFVSGTIGSGKESYLLAAGKEENSDMGQVLDLEVRRLFPPIEIADVLNQGYWCEYTGSQSILSELLKKLEE